MSVIDVQPVLSIVDHQAINVGTLADLIQDVMMFCRKRKGFTLFTMNLDHIVKRRRDPAFRAAYERATMVSADGWPVAALARREGAAVERVTGADLVVPLCAAAARERVPIFLFGSTEESLAGASAELRRLFPALDIRGMESPPMGFDPMSPSAVSKAEMIAASGARLCFVALGAPKQEFFADAMAARFPEIGFLCIGAALDFISGHQRRAPKIMQALNTEWLWRTMLNPRRLAARYAACAVVLVEVLFRISAGRSA